MTEIQYEGDYDHRIGNKQRVLLVLINELDDDVQGRQEFVDEADEYAMYMSAWDALKSSDALKSLYDRELTTATTYSSPKNLDLSEIQLTEEGYEVAKEVAKEMVSTGRLDADEVDFELDMDDQQDLVASII